MPRHALSNVSIASLKAEIDRRMKKLDSLKAQRDALDKQIAELKGQIGGKPQAAKKPGRKPGRKPKAVRAAGKPLADYIRDALAKAPKGLKVRAIEKVVLAAGYPTKAKDLYVPIMKALPKAGAKKMAPGVYGLKGKPGRKPGKTKTEKKPAKRVAAPAPQAIAVAKRKRKTFAQTGDQMVLSLLEGAKALTTAEINAMWKEQGRGGAADNSLTKLVKDGKVKREKIEGQRGSRYSLA